MAANTSTLGLPICCDDFNTKAARHTQILVDYYEGHQLKYLEKMLDGQAEGGYGKRVNWRQRGITPRVRNIVKSIVDKSGLLFNVPPSLKIKKPNQPVAATDEFLNALLESADWLEVFQNIDSMVRLTKSIVLLQQKYVPNDTVTVNGQYKFDQSNGDALLLTPLHQGNAVVKMNPQRTQITALAFLTDPNDQGTNTGVNKEDGDWTYRLITPTEILDILVKANKPYGGGGTEVPEIITNRQPNPDGFVPASFFYDTNKPYQGYWANPPEDIRSLAEMYNLALIDDEFAVSWQKQKTAIIKGKIKNNNPNLQAPMIPHSVSGQPGGADWERIPAYQQENVTHLGGLGSIIQLSTDNSGEASDLKFMGPDTDLMIPFNVIKSHAENIASDWDVSLAIAGSGSATSGFQLVVEEMDNLNLRQKRSQSMVAGFRRFYEVLKQIYIGQLPDGMLQVEFGPPNLPVNQAEREQIWTVKIAANRASPIDYFMEVEGMTQEEANTKLQEVISVNNMVTTLVKPAPAIALAETNADKPIKPFHTDSQNG